MILFCLGFALVGIGIAELIIAKREKQIAEENMRIAEICAEEARGLIATIERAEKLRLSTPKTIGEA